MGQGILIDRESFFSSLRGKDGKPLTSRDFERSAGARLMEGYLEPGGHLFALVLALGNERVKRQGLRSQSAWGDERLDMLQFTLLSYGIAINNSNAHPFSSSLLSSPLWSRVSAVVEMGAWLAKKIFEKLSDEDTRRDIGKYKGVPLTEPEVAKHAPCAALILSAYAITLQLQPDDIWHRQPDQPKTPHRKKILTRGADGRCQNVKLPIAGKQFLIKS
jgi:hypothetical protein